MELKITVLDRAKVYKMEDIIDFPMKSIATKNIVDHITGTVNAIAVNRGQIMVDSTIPFETMIQVIQGKANITIRDEITIIEQGQFMIIPSHVNKIIKALTPLKIISTVIKSGYEELI